MEISQRLKNKIALVTGSASGIGEGIARLFADHGARLILVDVQESKGRQVEELIRREGGEVSFIKADLEDGAGIPALLSDAIDRFKGLDILVNNAALYGWVNKKSAADTPGDIWNRTLQVNLTAPFLLAKYSIPHMIKRGGGSIVNVSSIGGLEAFPEFAAYTASKGGLIQLTKSLALDFGQHGIRANAICPGAIDTPGNDVFVDDRHKYLETVGSMTALKRVGKPEDVAYGALFLASDESRYVTGITLVVDGGRMAMA